MRRVSSSSGRYARSQRFAVSRSGPGSSPLPTTPSRTTTGGAAAQFTDALDIVDPAPPPEQVALLADERRLLATALALLPVDQRYVIELRLSGIPSVEVAEILGRSPEAVRALQLRATRRLQTLLSSPGAAPEVRHA